MIQGPASLMAPLVLNPMMARLAEQAGFRALYLGGGAMGLSHLRDGGQSVARRNGPCRARHRRGEPPAADPRRRLRLGAIRCICTARSAWPRPPGFAAIEIEDQILPKRAHHLSGSSTSSRQS
ncbi:MAG: hypothetical protein WDN49_17225 [Acetobacteraceae bacterium]